MTTKNDQLFRSWKEIAAYLGCDKRTCLRWEKKLGLPIHRAEGVLKGSVFAYKEEIDQWIMERFKSGKNGADSHHGLSKDVGGAGSKRKWRFSNPWLWVPFHLVVWALIAGAVLIITHKPMSREPRAFKIDDSVLIVLNTDGKELWRRDTGVKNLRDETAFKARFQRKTRNKNDEVEFPWIGFADIDHDGRKETLFVTKTLDEFHEGEILCFNDRGVPLWRFKAGCEQVIGGQPYSADYRIGGFDLFDLDQDGKEEVVFYATQKPYYPSQFVVLAADGRLKGEYWNSGHFNDFAFADLNGDGRTEVVACGVNNEYGKGFIAVFSPPHISGASPQIHGEYRFRDLNPGSEKFYVLIPRTDVDINTYPVDACANISILENKEISVLSNLSRLYYEFSFALEPLRVRTSHGFQVLHRKAVEEKKVTSVMTADYYDNLKHQVLYWDGEMKTWTPRPAMSNKW